MNNYISFKINEVSIKELKGYFNPNLVNTYCSKCNKYNKIWSCPPLNFNDDKYISTFKYSYIISGKIYIDKVPSELKSEMIGHALNKYSGISNSKDNFSNVFNALYYSFRELNDSKILNLEEKFPGSTALVSGRCLICNNCTRESNLPCIHPDKLRYSLESLGFDVAEIIENIVGDKIQWSSNESPEYVTCVSALLSNKEINPNEILNNLK